MKKTKTLALLLCAVLLVCVSVLGTLAYLTSQDTITNTFTVGQVNIHLDEAKVTPDGVVVEGADRVKENAYHLIPGQTYVKDPTLAIEKDSEDAYVRMLVEINCAKELDEIFAPGVSLTSIFNGYDENTWIYTDEVKDVNKNTVTYEFRYKEIVKKPTDNASLDPLFDSITIPATMTGEDLAKINDLKITVIGHAIQATGFDDVDKAWEAFEVQMK